MRLKKLYLYKYNLTGQVISKNWPWSQRYNLHAMLKWESFEDQEISIRKK